MFCLATSLSGRPCWVIRGASLASTLERWEQATKRVSMVRASGRGGEDVISLSIAEEVTPIRYWLLDLVDVLPAGVVLVLAEDFLISQSYVFSDFLSYLIPGFDWVWGDYTLLHLANSIWWKRNSSRGMKGGSSWTKSWVQTN